MCDGTREKKRSEKKKKKLVENVREPLLRWELRKGTESKPAASFIEVRHVAVRWSTETDGGKRRVRAATRKSRQETA